jgi:hypothetical protein
MESTFMIKGDCDECKKPSESTFVARVHVDRTFGYYIDNSGSRIDPVSGVCAGAGKCAEKQLREQSETIGIGSDDVRTG